MSGFGWRRLCVFQASINCSMISITAICFANVKYNSIVLITCAIFTYICTCYGIKDENTTTLEMMIFVIFIPAVIFLMFILASVNQNFKVLIDMIVMKSKSC